MSPPSTKPHHLLSGRLRQPPPTRLAPSTATVITVTAATPTEVTRNARNGTAASEKGSTLAELAPGAQQATTTAISTATTSTTTSTTTAFESSFRKLTSTIKKPTKRPRQNDSKPASPSSTSSRSKSIEREKRCRYRSPSDLSLSSDQSLGFSRSTSAATSPPDSAWYCQLSSGQHLQPTSISGSNTGATRSLASPSALDSSPRPRSSCGSDSAVGVAGPALPSPSASSLDRSDPRHPLHKKYLDDYFLHQIPDLETDHSLGLSITSIEEDMDPMHFGSGGSKPISMVNNPHRDTGLRPRDSLTGSVYAGGNSVSMSRTPYLGGSWVRDNILPTSFTQQHQSPSAHSSSYQPKFEATVLSNFLCCGKEIKNLHDLLQHHESVHANQPVSNPSQLSGFQPSNARGRPSGLGQDQFAGQNNHLSANNGMYHFSAVQQQQQQRSVGQVSRDQRHLAMTANMDEMEPVGDMEMDEAVGHLELDDGLLAQKRRPVFSQQQNRTMMQTNAPSGLSQALRPSQSHAAGAQTFGMQQQHDPSVTSVNTSTLAAQHHQQQLDQAFMQDHTMGHNGAGAFGAMDLSPGYGGLPNFNNLGFAAAAAMNSNNTNNNSDYCINDPAKALYSPGNPHPPGNIHLFGDTPAGRNLQHQLLQNMNLSIQGLQAHPQRPLLEQIGTMVLRGGEDDKPHKCPVVGCDKAYKNSNGLKYHKAHGHLNQQLHDNGDGTFSIINPETSTPYPGTEGMEKEKPFYCDMCNKRYKNPNGLKYHRLHSDCNPQQKLQKLQELQAAGVPGALSLFPDGLVDGMSSALNAGLPMGMPNGMGNGMDGGLSGGISNGLLAPMSDQMVDMDLSDFIDGC